jgi:hypothetical protein
MKRKHIIEIRANGKPTGQTIKRALTARQVGNFNPLYCRYRSKTYLVKSDDGDVSDSFRRKDTYKLYIDTETGLWI